MLKSKLILLGVLLISIQTFAGPDVDMEHDMERAADVCETVDVGGQQLPFPSVVISAHGDYLRIQAAGVAHLSAAQARANGTFQANGASAGTGQAATDTAINAGGIDAAQSSFNARWNGKCECTLKQHLADYRSNPNPQNQEYERLLRLYDSKHTKWERSCATQIASYSRELTSSKITAASVSGQSGNSSNLLKYGAIAAAGVGAYMLLKGGGKDKDKEDEVTAEEKKQGVIALEDGTKISCFSQQHFQRTECKSTMLRMCQSSEKETSGGCNSFNNFYCSNIGEGKDSVYCTYTATTTYCNQTGELVKQSPACKWRQTRDNAACGEDPEAIGCRLAMSASELQAACANHPYDPVCKANATTVMTQPDASSETTAENTEGSAVETVNMGEGNVSLSSITSSGNSASVQTSNLENSNSAVISNLCASGQLLGCPN